MGGCAKKAAPPGPPAAVDLVPPGRRSAAFNRVSRELDLGGTLYGYVDLSGDDQKLAHLLQSVMKQAVQGPAAGPAQAAAEKLPAIFTALGFDDITAVGVSSVPEAGGQFRNRAFFYTPNGRHGLLLAFGGDAAPFTDLRLAPPDADFYAESQLDLPAFYGAIKKAVEEVGGPAAADMAERQLEHIGEDGGWSILEFVHALRGRITVLGRFEPGQTYRISGRPGMVFPKLLLLARLDGVGPIAERILSKSLATSRTAANGRSYYRLPALDKVEGMHAEVMIEGPALYFSTDSEFLEQCLHRQAGLDSNPAFQKLLAALGPEGNSLSYVGPNFVQKLQSLPGLNPDWDPATRQKVAFLLANAPNDSEPMMAVRRNLPDGILVRAHYNRSFKREAALPIVYNPVTFGLMLSLAQFQKTQAAQQERARAQMRAAQEERMRAQAQASGRANGRLPSAAEIPTEGDHPPRARSQAAAAYPEDLMRHRVPGVVAMEFLVGPSGAVSQVQPRMSTNPELSAAAVSAVGRWTFVPGVRNGRPVSTRLQAPVVFSFGASRPVIKSLNTASNWYGALQKEWLRVQTSDHGGRIGRGVDRLVWLRVGASPDGGLEISDLSPNSADSEAASARRVLEASWRPPEVREDLLTLVRQAGEIEVAFPVYLEAAPAAEAPRAGTPSAQPPAAQP